MSLSSPIIKKINDNIIELNKFEKITKKDEFEKDNVLIGKYPTVYIHTWKKHNKYEAYVGETNNIFQRTKEHYIAAKDENNWQNNIVKHDGDLYIIGHEHFNKSLTLDIENRLIHYLTGVEKISKVYNSRNNYQGNYYTSDEFEQLFSKVWRRLKQINNEMFPSESIVRDSAIFKASPLHILTPEQQKYKENILNKVYEILLSDEKGKLIFVEGDSGTGKTVLNSSMFYDLCCLNESYKENENPIKTRELKCAMIVNHKEQLKVYREILKKLDVDSNRELVYSATSFINEYDNSELVDVSFVDEAHLLLTRGRQSYRGHNQLQDIIDRSKVTIIMFDFNQILKAEQYWEYDILEKYKKKAIEDDSYYLLKNQLRINASRETIKWIDDLTKNGVINVLPKNDKKYDIKVFDSPQLLERAIKKKAADNDFKLSRMVATYDWEYNDSKSNNGKNWEVKIGKWSKPWNYQIGKDKIIRKKRNIEELSWAEKDYTIDEIGSTFTIQGFDLNYVGVIIGPTVKYKDNNIFFDSKETQNKKAIEKRTLSDGTKKEFSQFLLRNEFRILMTRGVNGLYIYACDPILQDKLIECVGEKNYIR